MDLNILTWPRRIAKQRIVVHVILEGEPLSKQRPRFSTTKNGRVYTPRQTKDCEEWIGWQIKAAYRQLVCDDTHSFGVRVVYHQSSYQRRDIDNMTKLLFDACTGLVWKDDSQVDELIAHVFRGVDKPKTELCIYDLGITSRPATKCLLCGKAFRSYPSWKYKLYCSRKCQILATRTGEVVKCAHCGKDMYRTACQRRRVEFCSQECKSLHTTVEVACAYCGKTFRKPQSTLRGGRTYCSLECKASYWREHRAKAARGVCEKCGGPTSKKKYRLCMACTTENRQHCDDQYHVRMEKGQSRTIVEVTDEE